ncbi:MAG: hypothetical protein J6J17_00915 [Bacilli bacterium]|nr:hypothetical protein [Bacilli bacterium]
MNELNNDVEVSTPNNQKENRKGNNIYIFIIIFLILIIIGFCIYIFLDKKSDSNYKNKKNNTNVTEEKTEKNSTPEKNNNYTFLEQYENEIQLNGKKHNVLIYYYNKPAGQRDYEGEMIDLNFLYKEIFLDNKKIDAIFPFDISSNSYVNEYVGYDKNNFSSSDFKIIKDIENNEEYIVYSADDLTISLNENNLSNYYLIRKLYVINKDGKIIYNFSQYAAEKGSAAIYGTNSQFDDLNKYMEENNTHLGSKKYIVKNNRIYYMYSSEVKPPRCVSNSYTEYQVEIKNGKAIVNQGKTFTEGNISLAGGC